MNYPKVLIVALGRINAADSTNNGLLLRNLFGRWPKENVAQIFSSADNGDEGYFGRYYQMGPRDRRFGRLFYRQKKKQLEDKSSSTAEVNPGDRLYVKRSSVKDIVNRVFVDTGLYELVFRPKLSDAVMHWVKDFSPDIIFAQGYCLTFAWLPAMLADHCKIPVAYYPTDDWPSAAYRLKNGGFPIVSRLVGRSIEKAARKLVEISSVRLAFNPYMQEAYAARYGKPFDVLMHGDDIDRFRSIQPVHKTAEGQCWIVCAGAFYGNRLDLLMDLDMACGLLRNRGVTVKATVFPVNQLPVQLVQSYRFINVEPCPTHDGLAAVLKGADILYLPERFDSTATGIRLSVSSKAHLYMFSEKPIIVYSDAVTGLARYASDGGWARVVVKRDPALLADSIELLMNDKKEVDRISVNARKTADRNHTLAAIQDTFHHLLLASLKYST